MKRLFSRLLSLVLVASIFLVGCSSSSNLSGNYYEDTRTVVSSLQAAVELPDDDPDKTAAQAQAGQDINDYIARYRRDGTVNTLASFMTMSTALNALAGHYNTYTNRPVPDSLKKRLNQEFKQVEFALNRETTSDQVAKE